MANRRKLHSLMVYQNQWHKYCQRYAPYPSQPTAEFTKYRGVKYRGRRQWTAENRLKYWPEKPFILPRWVKNCHEQGDWRINATLNMSFSKSAEF
ncbi:hypothetical protein [uncultured Limosilactobacillus sp.]|uniref:hypothetical protein n=1 Tax=uncultured Limosilactobacillus sp. TaxID=2837629 RepID=UPI0025DEA965|nr:hypothetical protein [uncultured Limosilactobacillus sp.]